MVWGLIENFRAALKYRGGWKNLYYHMYTVSFRIRRGEFPYSFLLIVNLPANV